MSPLPIFRKLTLWFCLFCLNASVVFAQSYLSQGGEYTPAGYLLGDQTYPYAAVRTSGGYIIWQDNATDGAGLGISARKLDSSLSGSLATFRVNEQGAGDQERPQASLLNDGGAVFVWQGGRQGFQNIYGRFLSSGGTWTTGDVLVNSFTNGSKLNPVVTTLANGNVVVAWGSFNQVSSSSYQDVYAQVLSPSGAKVGGEHLLNQFTSFNQRTPAIGSLPDGRFVAVWISEQQRAQTGGGDASNNATGILIQGNTVDVYGRFFDANGNGLGNEFLVNTTNNICANPGIAVASDGTFVVAWSEKDLRSPTSNSWDIVARAFSSAGVGGTTRRCNAQTFGDQVGPKIAANGTDYLVIWTSLEQDGSREGVFGRYLLGNGSLAGSEFLVTTTTAGPQMHPMVASDGNGRFLAGWTSFGGGVNSFDLQAQRYATVLQPLSPLDPPFVTVLSSNALAVSWPVLQGFSVSNYEVYADGTNMPVAVVTNNWWTMTGLAPSSTHCFQIAYVLNDTRRSPLSGSTCNTTYGSLVYGGIPYEWMIYYFGLDIFNWPSPLADSDGDGVSNRNEFLAGTDPTDADSVLTQRLRRTHQGLFLEWNTEPGLIYQVKTSPDFVTWTNFGLPRLAAGTVDSVNVGYGVNTRSYYRIIRLR